MQVRIHWPKGVPLPFKGRMPSVCAIFDKAPLPRVLCSYAHRALLCNDTQVARNALNRLMVDFLSCFSPSPDKPGTDFGNSFSVRTVMMHLLECKVQRLRPIILINPHVELHEPIQTKQLVEGRSFFHATIDLKLGESCARSSAACEPIYSKDRSRSPRAVSSLTPKGPGQDGA